MRDGTATSDFAPAKAEMIRPLADKAWDFAQKRLSCALTVTVNKSLPRSPGFHSFALQ